MPFDISKFIDKGFTTMVAMTAVYFVIQLGRLFTKYIPRLLDQTKEFATIWRGFVKAVEGNAIAIDKNTRITDINQKHSIEILQKLNVYETKFEDHNKDTHDVKLAIDTLMLLIQEKSNTEEVISLLKFIINRMEEEQYDKQNI